MSQLSEEQLRMLKLVFDDSFEASEEARKPAVAYAERSRAMDFDAIERATAAPPRPR